MASGSVGPRATLYALSAVWVGYVCYKWWQQQPPSAQQKQQQQQQQQVARETPNPTEPAQDKKARAPKRFTSRLQPPPKRDDSPTPIPSGDDADVHIFYSTLTGTAERYAQRLKAHLDPAIRRPCRVINLDYVEDYDDFFTAPPEPSHKVYILVLPGYEIECPLDYFVQSLRDTHNDFRVDSRPLGPLGGFAVIGLGDQRQYPGKKFCHQAVQVDKWLATLGARRIAPLATVDVFDAYQTFELWGDALRDILIDPSSVPALSTDDSSDTDDEAVMPPKQHESGGLVDLEDMGAVMANAKTSAKQSANKEMVSQQSPTYKALTKQGYTIVGSHSGVKICRWTKSALRGRGSCYKFSFYGIKSHLCMETTPSLACANKCTFCWRHGTNPVGTEWRWKVDPPEVILQGAIEGHLKKIKQLRTVPGVREERFEEAMTIRHCALSLVGEPIFYPYINEFVDMLHKRHISSFLVTNAQHPEALARISMVTQLYISIDASTKDSLKKVDRPLFKDFWERFLQCIDILSQKRQRTVYRLTLVKSYNMEEVQQYAQLIRRGRPCFVEIKGVTYCGNSDTSSLTMKNVPYYEDVVEFVTALRDELAKDDDTNGLGYEIATEHAHSNCILLAQNKFYREGVWHTHIDYDRFFQLVESGTEFGPEDYMAPTPEFAVFGNGGFNPEDERFYRKGKGPKST